MNRKWEKVAAYRRRREERRAEDSPAAPEQPESQGPPASVPREPDPAHEPGSRRRRRPAGERD